MALFSKTVHKYIYIDRYTHTIKYRYAYKYTYKLYTDMHVKETQTHTHTFIYVYIYYMCMGIPAMWPTDTCGTPSSWVPLLSVDEYLALVSGCM